MSRSLVLYWAPLPDGRPWWPAIIVDIHSLDPVRHAKALAFWKSQSEKRGSDPLNKDVLVLLYELVVGENESDGGHRFAVVPSGSLRSYELYAPEFSQGVVSSGKLAGQTSSQEQRSRLQFVLNHLKDSFAKFAPQTIIETGSANTPKTGAGGVNSKRSVPKPFLEESKELAKLKKELSSVRRRLLNRTRPQSASPSQENSFLLGNSLPNTKLENPSPTPCPEINAQILRTWDFCHAFSDELNLTSMTGRKPFASLCSFETCLSEPECSLYSQVACQLVSYLSISKGQDPEDRWIFDTEHRSIKAKVGGRCTPLTWECLYESLIEAKVISAPSVDPSNRREILDTLIQACCELDCTKMVFHWRLNELHTENQVTPDMLIQNAGPHPEVEVRQLNKPLNPEIFTCRDFFHMERLLEICRAEHEGYDPTNGTVVWRSLEFQNALKLSERLLAQFLISLRIFRLTKRIRTLSIGKDHANRDLFSFSGDEDEESMCRVWARDNQSDTWSVYQGENQMLRLIHAVDNRETKRMLQLVIYASRQRLRPRDIARYRLAVNSGWRFTDNQHLGKLVKKFDLEFGVCPGIVASWLKLGEKRVYRVVFTKQEWQSGINIMEEELLHLLNLSEHSLLGDFPLHPSTLPLHPFGPCAWIPIGVERLVVVRCPIKKLIALGVLLATSAPLTSPNYDGIVLADGGEFVFLFGKQAVDEAIRMGVRFSGDDPTRFNRLDRFRPLTHHQGPLVGSQGVVELWGKVQVESVFDLRSPMLIFEDAFVKKAKNMWPDPGYGQIWRVFVENADSVKAFALALECLLDFAARAAQMAQFYQQNQGNVPQQPSTQQALPDPNEQPSSTSAAKSEQENPVKRQKVDGSPDQEENVTSANTKIPVSDMDFENMQEAVEEIETMFKKTNNDDAIAKPEALNVSKDENEITVIARSEDDEQITIISRTESTDEEMKQRESDKTHEVSPELSHSLEKLAEVAADPKTNHHVEERSNLVAATDSAVEKKFENSNVVSEDAASVAEAPEKSSIQSELANAEIPSETSKSIPEPAFEEGSGQEVTASESKPELPILADHPSVTSESESNANVHVQEDVQSKFEESGGDGQSSIEGKLSENQVVDSTNLSEIHGNELETTEAVAPWQAEKAVDDARVEQLGNE